MSKAVSKTSGPAPFHSDKPALYITNCGGTQGSTQPKVLNSQRQYSSLYREGRYGQRHSIRRRGHRTPQMVRPATRQHCEQDAVSGPCLCTHHAYIDGDNRLFEMIVDNLRFRHEHEMSFVSQAVHIDSHYVGFGSGLRRPTRTYTLT